jgi:hypothetical protein
MGKQLLGSWITQQLIQAYHQYGVNHARLCKLQKKGELDSQPQVIKFTSCLPAVLVIGLYELLGNPTT